MTSKKIIIIIQQDELSSRIRKVEQVYQTYQQNQLSGSHTAKEESHNSFHSSSISIRYNAHFKKKVNTILGLNFIKLQQRAQNPHLSLTNMKGRNSYIHGQAE